MPADATPVSRPPRLSIVSHARVATPSTPDVVATALREAIVSGAIRAGTQLRQNEVAADFGVSVIPVREALRQLEAQGFVVLHRNRGAVVAEISLEEIREIFEIRIVLETMLVRRAIPRLAAVDLRRAEEYLRALDKEPDVHKWGHWNWLFHETLYAPAGRTRTLGILRNLHSHIDRLLRLQMTLAGGKRKSHREHMTILGACRDRDTERAIAVLTRHIRSVGDIILRFAEQQHKQRRAPGASTSGQAAAADLNREGRRSRRAAPAATARHPTSTG